MCFYSLFNASFGPYILQEAVFQIESDVPDLGLERDLRITALEKFRNTVYQDNSMAIPSAHLPKLIVTVY